MTSSQSHFYILFIFIKIIFYLLSFLCNVCNEIRKGMSLLSELLRDHHIMITNILNKFSEFSYSKDTKEGYQNIEALRTDDPTDNP